MKINQEKCIGLLTILISISFLSAAYSANPSINQNNNNNENHEISVISSYSNKMPNINRNLRSKTKKKDTCDKPIAYSCNCEKFSKYSVNIAENIILKGGVNCVPICNEGDVAPGCDKKSTEESSVCDNDFEQSLCILDHCGMLGLTQRDVGAIRLKPCEYIESLGYYACSGGLTIDPATHKYVTEGTCIPACNVQQMVCQTWSMFGPAYFPEDKKDKEEKDKKPHTKSKKTNGKCDNGKKAKFFKCGCEVIERDLLKKIEEVLGGQHANCEPICDGNYEKPEQCKKDCDTDVCIGPREGVMCATFADAVLVTFIQSSTCEYEKKTHMMKCEKGESIVRVDEPSYGAMINGQCLPSCEFSEDDALCIFTARFGKTILVDIPPAPEPAPESAPEPAPESAPEPAPESAPEPAPESAPEPAPESAPEPAPESAPEPAPESAPEPAPESAPEPAPESAPEPAPESAPECAPAPEPYVEINPCDYLDIFYYVHEMEEDMLIDELNVDWDGYKNFDFSICFPPESAPAPSEESIEEIPDIEPSLPPEPDNTTLVIEIVISDESTTTYNTNYRVVPGPWRECPQTCLQAAEGETIYQERSVSCVDTSGIVVSILKCDQNEVALTETAKECQDLKTCKGGYYFVYGEWSECDATCAVYDSKTKKYIPGYSRRDEICINEATGLETDVQNCIDNNADRQMETVKECNTILCEPVYYIYGEWSECDCKKNTKTRNVICVELSSQEEVSVDKCVASGLESFTAEKTCDKDECDSDFDKRRRVLRKLLQEDIDICANTTCSKHGECQNDGSCECEEGFEGLDCQLDNRTDSKCPLPSQLDGYGNCCTSGIFDWNTGKCCPGTFDEVQVDKDGSCCSFPLDDCGNCNGISVVDALGKCCDRRLDAQGICCPRGDVDSCGVCNGFEASCLTELSLGLNLTENSITSECKDQIIEWINTEYPDWEIEDVKYSTSSDNEGEADFEILSVLESRDIISESITSHILISKFENGIPETKDCNISSVKEVIKLGICSNGLCEAGEAVSGNSKCEEDCLFDVASCDTEIGFGGRSVVCNGHGSCSFVNNPSCICFPGYKGEQCELCSEGFYLHEDRCHPRQNALMSVMDPEASIPEPEASIPEPEASIPSEGENGGGDGVPDVPGGGDDDGDDVPDVPGGGDDDDDDIPEDPMGTPVDPAGGEIPDNETPVETQSSGDESWKIWLGPVLFAAIILLILLLLLIYKKRKGDEKEGNVVVAAAADDDDGNEGEGGVANDGEGEDHTLVTDNPLSHPKFEKSYSGIWSTFIKGLSNGKKTTRSKSNEKEEMLDSQSSPIKTITTVETKNIDRKENNIVLDDNEMVKDDESVSSHQNMLDIKKWDSQLVSFKVTDELMKENSHDLDSVLQKLPKQRISKENLIKEYDSVKSDDNDDQENDFDLSNSSSKRKTYMESKGDIKLHAAGEVLKIGS